MKTITDIVGSTTITPTTAIDLDQRGRDVHKQMMADYRCSYFRSNCPIDYLDFNVEYPSLQTNRRQIEEILNWKENPVGILATGSTGTGKTRAMFALCKRLIQDEAKEVAIWPAKKFFYQLESNVRYGHDEAGEFIKCVAHKKILFIDDYGQESVLANKQDWATGWFFKLLDIRVGNRLPLLMTTNLTAEQIASRSQNTTGAPLLRRLIESSKPIKFI